MRPAVLACLWLLLASAHGQTTFKCDPFKQDRCFDLLPFCREYIIIPQSVGFLFKCLECSAVQGYEPILEGVMVTKMDYQTNLPIVGEFDKAFVELCKRSTFTEGIRWCNHPACHMELPHCKKYEVINIEQQPGRSGSDYYADFSCLQCSDLYEPISDKKVRASLQTKVVKHLCHRKIEARECGEHCQKEFPGCLFYSITNRKWNTDSLDSKVEYADFTCEQPMPGYLRIMRQLTYPTMAAKIKETVLRKHRSHEVDCSDLACRHVFPNCLAYRSTSYDQHTNFYQCIQCRDGYRPLLQPVLASDFYLLYLQKEAKHLCQLETFERRFADAGWKDEMPGCKVLSVSETSMTEDGQQVAHYTCDECEDGMEAVLNGQASLVMPGWEIANHVKTRCRPKYPEAWVEVGSFKNMFPNCQMIKMTFEPNQPAHITTYECTQCVDGFTPVHVKAFDAWYSRSPRWVCKPEATVIDEDESGPVVGEKDCDGLCQETFPGCERLTVIYDQTKMAEYRCSKCVEGQHPINYQESTRGILKESADFMARQNKIFLCTDNQEETYIGIADCSNSQLAILDSKACHATVNCLTIVTARNRFSGEVYEKCVECPQGFKIKNKRPHKYDIDQRACEKI